MSLGWTQKLLTYAEETSNTNNPEFLDAMDKLNELSVRY